MKHSSIFLILLLSSLVSASSWNIPKNTVKLWLSQRTSLIDNSFDLDNGNPTKPVTFPWVSQSFTNISWSWDLKHEVSFFLPFIYNLNSFNIQQPSTIAGSLQSPKLINYLIQYHYSLEDEEFSSAFEFSYEQHIANKNHTLSLGYSKALYFWNWEISSTLSFYNRFNKNKTITFGVGGIVETYKEIAGNWKVYLATNGVLSDWFFYRTTGGLEYTTTNDLKWSIQVDRTWIGKWVYKDVALKISLEWLVDY